MFVKCLMQRSFFFSPLICGVDHITLSGLLYLFPVLFFFYSLFLFSCCFPFLYKNVIYITWLAGRSKKKAGQCNIHAKKKKSFLIEVQTYRWIMLFHGCFCCFVVVFFLLSFPGKACIMLRCNMSEKYVCIPQMATEAIAIMES